MRNHRYLFTVLLSILACSSLYAQNPIIVNVTPNTAKTQSGNTIQFKATVTNTTNTKVTWHSCIINVVDQNGLFTAPPVSATTVYCVYAISVADPSKSGTAYATVTPLPKAACKTTTPFTSTEVFYQLPTWMTPPNPSPLTWVQPADIMYQSTEFTNTSINITSWTVGSSPDNIVFTAVNTLAIGEFVKLQGFQVSTFFNGQTVEVSAVTPTDFTAYFVNATGSPDHGIAILSTPSAIQSDSANVLPPINSRAGDVSLYCDWLLVQGGKPPYTYSVTNAPTGLKVNSATGQYSGTASTPGTWSNIVFCAKDSVGTQVCLKPKIQTVCTGGTQSCTI
jgi:hypothetical protein